MLGISFFSYFWMLPLFSGKVQVNHIKQISKLWHELFLLFFSLFCLRLYIKRSFYFGYCLHGRISLTLPSNIWQARLKNVVIFFQTILSFVLSRKIINIYNDLAWTFENVTTKDFHKYEKQDYKNNKLKSDIFSTTVSNLECIRNYLSLNCKMFQINMLH